METAATTEATSTVGLSDNARRALTVGGLGAAALAFGATAASAADTDALTLVADIESAAVAGFTAAAGLKSVQAAAKANAVVGAFLTKSLAQHKEALAALTKAGAKPAAQVPASILKALGIDDASALTNATAGDVVTLATKIEDTIVATCSKQSLVSVSSANRQLLNQVGVAAAQRQAILRAVGALVAAGHLELVALDGKVVAKLPDVAGKVGFPDAYAMTSSAIASV